MEWYELILQQTITLLKAPVENSELLWITIPLAFTILIMTFYFGLYKREQLGWNTAIGNSIVLLFICVDLLRMIYHYTEPPATINYLQNPWKSVITLTILLEAIIMAIFAFNHTIPARIMYFIASPLPVNLQAYVIIIIVYTKMSPNRYTAGAAVIMFAMLFITINILKISESIYVNHKHKQTAKEINQLIKEGKQLQKEAKNSKQNRKKRLQEQAKEKTIQARILANKLAMAEEMEHGELVFAKKLLKLDKKNFMF